MAIFSCFHRQAAEPDCTIQGHAHGGNTTKRQKGRIEQSFALALRHEGCVTVISQGPTKVWWQPPDGRCGTWSRCSFTAGLRSGKWKPIRNVALDDA